METQVSAEGVKNVVKAQGYEVIAEDGDGVFTIRGSSGVKIICAVEQEIVNFTVPLITVPEAKITRDVALAMLWNDNGLATSHIELVKVAGGKVRVILMNYCKLKELGDDDVDDIDAALQFLELDTVRARKVLGALA
jgi:hypothetical protein